MRIISICFFVAMFSIFACNKKERIGDKEYVTLSYNQTQCADPWGNGSTDSLTLVNVASYLNTSGLYIAGLSIKQVNGGTVCTGCNCSTGKVIYVSTLNSSTLKEKYAQIGFK